MSPPLPREAVLQASAALAAAMSRVRRGQRCHVIARLVTTPETLRAWCRRPDLHRPAPWQATLIETMFRIPAGDWLD
jgi:hypothetical protein